MGGTGAGSEWPGLSGSKGTAFSGSWLGALTTVDESLAGDIFRSEGWEIKQSK